MLVGNFDVGTLENSYQRAFKALDCQVVTFDIFDVINRNVRFGYLGRLFNRFVPVEPWIQKAHRELALKVMDIRPDLVLTFGQQPLRVGSLSLIRVSTDANLIHVWPDTPLNLNTHLSVCIPLYNHVANYSKEMIPVFRTLGAGSPLWVPLAGDPSLHPIAELNGRDKEVFEAEITFIGGWRPERERVLSQLKDFELHIWGTGWGRCCRGNRPIMRAWQGRPLYGMEFAKAVAASKINLNIIDPTNYPAANMRFFEIPTAGGLQVSSPCPEMEDEFKEGEHIFYYHNIGELIELVRHLLSNDALRVEVASRAHQRILENHTYVHRAGQILDLLADNT